MTRRPIVRPKDRAAYNQAKAKRTRNRIIVALLIVSILAAIFWEFTAAVILIAITGIFTATSPWVLPLFAYMSYNDNHRR